MAGANVLVIEDDQANADVLTDALRSEEVRVDAGREFLAVTR